MLISIALQNDNNNDREISGDNNVDIEVSLEANPSDVKDSVNDLKLAGLTRLSLGIQSFDDREEKIYILYTVRLLALIQLIDT